DIKRYHDLTLGKRMVMGYGTFATFKEPLPNRTNIVLSSKDGNVHGADQTIHSIEEIYELEKHDEELFVIGGGQVFAQTIGQADRMYLTVVHMETEGDAFFPKYDIEQWNVIEQSDFKKDANNAFDYTFLTLEK